MSVSSRIAVQIYEIQDPKEAEAVAALGVDRIGSVLLSEDRWMVSGIKEAVRVSKSASIRHSIIALFGALETLFRVIDFYQPDILHFCESLVNQYGKPEHWEKLVGLQATIREAYPELEIMRTVPIPPASWNQRLPILQITENFAPTSDCFLIDTWIDREPVTGFVGITGRPCDWTLAKQLVDASSIPVILAGGLSPQNVYDAILATRPQGVDSCTKTNLNDRNGNPIRFKKDLEKLTRFIDEVRRAENYLAHCAL
ncbi:MAG: hypothetical protein JRI36_13095 [Deltaproteobacteria bacterium]|nr:hypothetical protein [Deltaproteobacteria bacterium]